jgi:opacity protein-like surface antigen
MITGKNQGRGFAAAVLCLFAVPATCVAFDGAYYGVAAGLFQAKTATEQSIFKPNAGANAATHAGTIAGVGALDPSPEKIGLLGGAHAGYNRRHGAWAIGAEVDASYWGYDASATEVGSAPANFGNRAPTTTITAKATWLLAVRPRVGYMISDREMVYGVLGVAFSDLKYTSRTTILSNGGTTAYESSAKAKPAILFGLGYERALGGRMSVRLDYQYAQFRKAESTGGQMGTLAPDLDQSSVTSTYKTSVNALRAGVSWRF